MYYVYIITNPLKEQKVPLPEINLELTHQPIYVGKGSGNRWKSHFYPSIARENTVKWKYLKRLVDEFNMEEFTVIYNTTSEDEAYKLEKRLIKKIGRRKTGRGPLLNLLEGGKYDHPSGQLSSDKRRDNYRKKVDPQEYVVVIDYNTGEVLGECAIVYDVCAMLGWEYTKKTREQIGYAIRGYRKRGTNKSKVNHYKGYKFVRKQDYNPLTDYTKPTPNYKTPPLNKIDENFLFQWYCGSTDIFDVITRVCYTEQKPLSDLVVGLGDTQSGRIFEYRLVQYAKKYIYDNYNTVIPWDTHEYVGDL